MDWRGGWKRWVVGSRAEPVIMLTPLDTFKETLGQFPANVSGNQMDALWIFLTRCRSISCCVCGDQTKYMNTQQELFLTLSMCE